MSENSGEMEASQGPPAQSTAQRSATDQVFETFELLENILLEISPRTLMKLRRVNRTFNDTISTSPVIKWLMFRHPGDKVPPTVLSDPRLQGCITRPIGENMVEMHPLVEHSLSRMWNATVHIDRPSTRRHPFDATIAFPFPNDVFITRPPVRNLCVTTNSPASDITIIEASDESPGITMKQFLDAVAGPCLDRYRELLRTSKKKLPYQLRLAVVPEICLRVKEVYADKDQAHKAMMKIRQRAMRFASAISTSTLWTISSARQEGAEFWDSYIIEDVGNASVLWKPILKVRFYIGHAIHSRVCWYDDQRLRTPKGWELVIPSYENTYTLSQMN
ncbi:hypothetical protein AA313_de0200334 [Arthrobotrys entomopaga]|nr:hypothetical protein AA313_de0200334 [Arthrobotrys entomopaga]